MAEYLIQQSFLTTSGLPKDVSQNTWSIRADDVAACVVASAAIFDLYDNVRGIFSNNVVQNGHPYKIFDRADTPPRAPVAEGTYDFTGAPTAPPQPHEVALVLSFQGAVSSGLPQSRNRGRVFIGPCSTTHVDTDARVDSTIRDAIAAEGRDLLIASNAASAWTWVVWSTVLGSSGIITNGWIDNAWDTQRRRGRESTVRTTYTASTP